MKKALLARLKSGGFTMIELLIVIAILGILAVLVLSAINPLEQINRGRDTAKRSDAEQLLSAVERFNAFQTTFPWRDNNTDVMQIGGGALGAITQVTADEPATTAGCAMLDKLAQGDGAACVGTEELKASYLNRVTGFGAARALYIYNQDADDPTMNTYVCFSPESNAFEQEADTRCFTGGVLNAPPADIDATNWGIICANTVDNAAGEDIPMICLP